MQIDRQIFREFDWILFGLAFFIPLCGLIVLYSAGYEPEGADVKLFSMTFNVTSPAMSRQIAFLGLGFLAMLVGMSLSPRALHRYAYALYAIGIVLLIGVFLFGYISKGAQRWLPIGSFRFQPSEVVKFTIIIVMARIISRAPPGRGGYSMSELIFPLAVILLPFALVIEQPDLGTALAIAANGGLMLLFAGIRKRTLIIAGLAASLIFVPGSFSPYQPLVLKLLKPYQQRRVLALFDPESDIQGSGWHIHQSKIAVGSGQLTGKGFLQGTQTQLEFLPEHTTDFIFSVLAEEWGFIGSIFLLLLYLLLLYRILRIVARSRDTFMAFLAVGVASQLFFHVFINMGMVIGILPVVGIPLPLMSYGGTSVVSTMFAIGLVLGVSIRRKQFVKQ